MTYTLHRPWNFGSKKHQASSTQDIPGVKKENSLEYNALKRAYDAMHILGRQDLTNYNKQEINTHLEAYRIAKEHYQEMHRFYEEHLKKEQSK